MMNKKRYEYCIGIGVTGFHLQGDLVAKRLSNNFVAGFEKALHPVFM